MSIDKLLKVMQQPERKLEVHRTTPYNGSMSRVEMLARALGGVVVEDEGYRGIVHIASRDEYIRYHSAHGVHAVIRLPRTWRATRLIFQPQEVQPFLEEQGVLPKADSARRDPLVQLAELLTGTVEARFQTGGGVVKTQSGAHIRFSQIAGLDVVEFIVSKWRVVAHLMDRNDTLRALAANPQSIVEAVDGRTRNGDDGVRAHSGGNPAGAGTAA